MILERNPEKVSSATSHRSVVISDIAERKINTGYGAKKYKISQSRIMHWSSDIFISHCSPQEDPCWNDRCQRHNSSQSHPLMRRAEMRPCDKLFKTLSTLLDLCVSSLRRGHANLLCIVPILTDDPRRESDKHCFCWVQPGSMPLPPALVLDGRLIIENCWMELASIHPLKKFCYG